MCPGQRRLCSLEHVGNVTFLPPQLNLSAATAHNLSALHSLQVLTPQHNSNIVMAFPQTRNHSVCKNITAINHAEHRTGVQLYF